MVIILNVGGTVLGAVVDAVADLVCPAGRGSSLPPVPEPGDGSFVRGIATVGERLLIVLNGDLCSAVRNRVGAGRAAVWFDAAVLMARLNRRSCPSSR